MIHSPFTCLKKDLQGIWFGFHSFSVYFKHFLGNLCYNKTYYYFLKTISWKLWKHLLVKMKNSHDSFKTIKYIFYIHIFYIFKLQSILSQFLTAFTKKETYNTKLKKKSKISWKVKMKLKLKFWVHKCMTRLFCMFQVCYSEIWKKQ